MNLKMKKLFVFGALLVSGSLTLAGCLAPATEDPENGGQQTPSGEGEGQGGEGQGGEGQGGETPTTTFPAQALKQFLTSEGVNVTVPSPVSSGEWTYKVEGDEEYGYSFVASVADSGTVGTNSIEDTYTALLQGTSGWTVSDEYYEYIGYVAFKDNVQLCYCTEEGAFNFEAYKYEAAQYEESTTFPATALQAFLTSEGLKTTVPAATGASSWRYAALSDEEGNYFAISAEDNGTPGKDAIEDTYKVTLQGDGWTIDDSEYEEYGYYADKGDVGIQFYSYDGEFDMYVYAAEGSGSEGGEGQGGGDTPVTPTGNDGTAAHPFTVSEAWTLIDLLDEGANNGAVVYVTGTVKGNVEYNSNHNSGTFLITDGTKTIKAYSISGVSVTQGDTNYVADGYTVVVSGALIKYVKSGETTYEVGYASNTLPSSLVSVTPKQSGSEGGEGGEGQGGGTTSADKAAWTIMIYMCGSDLESGTDESGETHPDKAGYASLDISEILSVPNQPDDVNIIIETGGAAAWKNTDIKATELGRWHVENKQLVKDGTVTKASMGKQSTFQSFLQWGLTSYPAEKTGVILWNHGGAMEGVCSDENFTDEYGWNDTLLNSEAKAAFQSVLGDNQKLEFIGYDACLMQVQDIAEFNSKYFNYMIGSEESEAGDGWAYDNWVDDLYAKKPTTTILKEICDSFINENDKYDFNDQTLSYLDLSKMSAYKTAWENFSVSLKSKLSTYGKNAFVELMKTVQFYGSERLSAEDYEYYSDAGYDVSDYVLNSDGLYYADFGYDYFGTFDVMDFLTKVEGTSALSGLSSEISAVKSAFNQLVVYSAKGNDAGNSNGLCLFFPAGSYTYHEEFYTDDETNFTNWRSIVTTYGVASAYSN